MPPVSPAAQVDYDRPMAAGISSLNSAIADTSGAIDELFSSLPLDTSEFVLLLHGPNHTGAALEAALARHPGKRFFGCSTSGEISPGGYLENTISAISFDRSAFSCVARKIEGLQDFGFQQARDLVLSMQWELREQCPQSNASNTFALLLIDSLSQAEEFVAAALGNELGTIHLVGGSSGDNWRLIPAFLEALASDWRGAEAPVFLVSGRAIEAPAPVLGLSLQRAYSVTSLTAWLQASLTEVELLFRHSRTRPSPTCTSPHNLRMSSRHCVAR